MHNIHDANDTHQKAVLNTQAFHVIVIIDPV